MEKYYLISGKALANIQFRCSGVWCDAGKTFTNERISERDLNKYRRFFHIEKQIDLFDEQKEEPNIEKPRKTTNANPKKPIVAQTQNENVDVALNETETPKGESESLFK